MADVTRTLWVASPSIDISDVQVDKLILKQPVSLVVLPVFTGGQSIYPTRIPLFSQMHSFKGKPDPLPGLIESAHHKGMSVYGYIDCLHWEQPGISSPPSPWSSSPM